MTGCCRHIFQYVPHSNGGYYTWYVEVKEVLPLTAMYVLYRVQTATLHHVSVVSPTNYINILYIYENIHSYMRTRANERTHALEARCESVNKINV